MIRNIIFDIGGVLIDLQPQRTLSALRALLDETIEELSDRSLLGGGQNEWVDKYMTGDIADEAFFAGLLNHAKAGVKTEDLRCAWDSMMMGLPARRVEAIQSLHREGVRVALLSNINDEHLRVTKEMFAKADFLLGRDYDYAFYSNELHLAKPDAAIYRLVLEQTGFAPEETLYIDDLTQNVAAAEGVGLKGLCATGDEWLEKIREMAFVREK